MDANVHRQARIARQRKVLISLFIVLVIGLHGLPVMFHRGATQTLWPFLTWGMYKNSRSPGPIEAQKTWLVGVTATGGTDTLTWQLIGLPRATIRNRYLKGMRANDSTAAQQLFQRLNANRPEPFVEIRLENEIYRLTGSGVIRGPGSVLTFRADSSFLN